MIPLEDRKSIFISHANPEDNAFTIWLGARLTAFGYEVWADVLQLRGGHDWQRRLEDVIRNQARKVLVVGTNVGMEKQGVRNEIQIAHSVGRELGDREFIIPLRLSSFHVPFLIAHAQYIDFEKGWADGLTELIDTLHETYQVPRNHSILNETADYWVQAHLKNARSLQIKPEKLVSNWISISQLPESVFLYNFRNRFVCVDKLLKNDKIPVIPFRQGVLSFCPIHEIQNHFNIGITDVAEIGTEKFVTEGWPDQYLRSYDTKSLYTNLIRRSIELTLMERELSAFEMSGGQKAWWGRKDKVPTDTIQFNWTQEMKGRRKIIGYSPKRSMYWHYGISPKPFLFPFPHVRLVHRVIFSQDGLKPIASPDYMHRLRRSYTKSWRNSKWRDMQLAFLYWLSSGREKLPIPVSSHSTFELQLPPIVCEAPVSVKFDEDHAEEEEPIDELESESEDTVTDAHVE